MREKFPELILIVMKRYFFPVFLLLLTTQLVLGQALLTADEAVKLVLKNNYDILIAGTATDISKANNTAGNAGMMPGIGLKAGDSYSMYNSTTNLTAGGTATYPDSRTNSFAAAAELSWTLFDGGKMFITKKKLNELEALGELNFRDKVSQTVYNTILAYYDVVRQKQQLSSIREAIHYNEERVKILQASFNAGLVPKTDLLQAQVDLNVYLENAILQETVILDSKRSLNQLLSRARRGLRRSGL